MIAKIRKENVKNLITYKWGCFLAPIRPSFLVRTSSPPYTAQIFILELSVPILPHIQLI
jgi:hypothetical protein